MIPSEHMLTWAKRIEAQRAQVTVMNILHEVRKFDVILQNDEGRDKQNWLHL